MGDHIHDERIHRMDTELIMRYLTEFRLGEAKRLERLGDYYAGRHDVLFEPSRAPKPDNRLVNNFCRSITDTTVGYLFGKGVTYSSDSESTLEQVNLISAINDEAFVNSALGRDVSVYGRAAELLWLDSDRRTRFTPIDPSSVVAVVGDSPDEELKAAIRFYVPRFSSDTVVEVYTPEGVETFSLSEGKLERTGEREHFFGYVPVNFYRNNRDMTGDFEPVMSLVDAYNRLESDCVNDFELFADSYLVISGMGGADREDIERFRRDRVLLVDEGGDARWLTKTPNDGYVENLKSRLARDIYRFSNTVDMSDEAFTGANVSGLAIKYRMAAFDNRVAVTEQYFRRSLIRRWRLISEVTLKLGEDIDWQSMDVRFTRNMPGNYEDSVDMASKLDGIVSKKTIHELLPFVKSADAERLRMDKERESEVC